MLRCALALFTAVIFTISAAAATETWQIDPAHSAAQFSIRHMGISTVRGDFTKTSGTVDYDPDDVSKSSLDVTIDAASINTRVDGRDNDLRGDHFFDVQKYPNITFKSKRVESAGAGKLKVTGDLTMHGVTKQVVLDVDGPSKPFKDPRGRVHMGASATTTINRSDYGMTAAAGMVGNEVSITIDVELQRSSGEAGK